MRALLWLGSLAGVLFLSLWPFRFRPDLATEAAWAEFAVSWGWQTRPGDAVGNIMLFVPVGILGMLALWRLPRLQRAAIVAAASFAIAVAGQAVQIVVPARTATLVDVTWNMVGLLPGMVLGLAPWHASPITASLRARLQVLPWLILSIWVVYRLVPFLPSLDWQLVKDNLKQLWFDPMLEPPDVVIFAAAWLAAGYLMQAGDAQRRLDLLLPLLMAVVMGLELVIVHGGGLSADNLAGGLLALGLWFGLMRRRERPAMLVWPALAAAIAVNGLWPFAFAPRPVASFHWLPFAGMLGWSMWFNLLAVTYKLYLYCAACFALCEVTRSWRTTALLAASYVFAIELLQCYQPRHVPEITDPLVVLLACLVGAAFTPTRPQASTVEA
jgi:VanZ family protein